MVKILSRDAINRMVGRKSSVAGVGGGGGDVDLSGYATKIWTQETFVSIDFFRSLFRAYDSQNHEILPNDTTSTIDNIKAMFGFWTEQYLSALGQGSGGGGGGASALSDLLDVQLTNPTNGQALVYDSSISKWVNRTVGGTDMATVWNALSGGTSEQINVSHLTNALSGYVTTSAISDMATHTWVGQQGYATQTWVNDNYLSIAFFNRLFQAYAGTGSSAIRVNPNDTTSTIDNVKAMFGFWTEQYISALGQGTGGGGGGVGDVTWDLLADNSDTRQIALSHLTTALSGYALTSQLPTKVSQLTNDSGFITSLGDCFRYQGLVANDYVTGTTYSTITNGSYQRQLSGSTDSLLHFQIGGSASGLDIRFSYIQDNSNPLQYRKCIDSNRFAGGWVTLIDSLNIGSQSVSYATSSGSATKLSTARTIWGQSFDGTANVSGALSGATTITASSDITTNGDLNGNGGIVKIEKQSGEPQLRFHTPGVAWGNIRLGSSGQFYFYQAYQSSVYASLNTGSIGVHGYIAISNGQRIHQTEENGSILYIGSSNNYGWVRIQDMCSQDGNAGDDYWSIRTSGAAVFTSVYSKTYVTALSDARHKDIIGDTGLTVEQIAEAPAIRFQWNDRDDQSVFAGSIAQYWQKVLPEVVQSQADGTLSLDYQVAALISSITVARKVVDHERRIAELERENKELKMKLNIA